MLVNEQIWFPSLLGSRDQGLCTVGRRQGIALGEACRGPDFDPGEPSPSASWGRSQQVSHAHQIVGRRGPGEHPPHSFQASKPRLAHQGHGLEPPKDFFHPLAFRLTGRVAPPWGVPVAAVRRVSTTRPWRFSISTWPRKANFASCPLAFLYNLASASVVEACVSLVRLSPRKFTPGFPGSESAGGGGAPDRGLKLFCPAQASISVPSTVKCSSDNSPCSRANFPSSVKKARATSASSRRSRFFENTVKSQTGSSMFNPTNQRNSRL